MKYNNINIPWDEIKSCIYRKKILFIIYFLSFWIIQMWLRIDGFIILYILKWILEESSPAGDQWKYRKYVSLQWKINFYSESIEFHQYFSIFHSTMYIMNMLPPNTWYDKGKINFVFFRDLIPIVSALVHNTWFTSLNANNVKLVGYTACYIVSLEYYNFAVFLFFSPVEWI